ncbi:uncharacterized protein LOC115756941 isoform X2 [Rhodamnia argentea]|uniref:Uncharacterized protein LOC115756941 isoform X2 n=1 Tax=Rhodamnia argentea TaxID=178133 RepID=A0A8B8R2U4_9MYRT|nr:uncharacterized protein LOC115756941 isoform X2 [Rhodamnia argentea]
MEATEIETRSDSIDVSLIFHLVNDVLGFVLYMHQQIPSILQDMSLEFDSMRSEYKEMEAELAQGEMRASFRRKHKGRMRELKRGFRSSEKLMNAISSLQDALRLVVSENPHIREILLVLGGSPLRPQYVYRLCFLHGETVSRDASDFTKSRVAEVLSRKAVRALTSRGAGSGGYPGPTKLFLLVKAPTSFNQPLYFLPKRDFRYNKKIVPFCLRIKCKSQQQEKTEINQDPQTGMSVSSEDCGSDDLIWFQCRHVIKGLASTVPSAEE